MITRTVLTVASTLLCAASALASPARPETVSALMEVTQTRQLMDGAYAQMEPLMRQMMLQQVQGKTLTAQQRQALDAMPKKFVAAMREEMSWDKLEPGYTKIYVETFSEEELQGLLDFYRSPLGQTYIQKMPVVMQKSMTMTQSLMKSMVPRMQQAVAESLREAGLEPPAKD